MSFEFEFDVKFSGGSLRLHCCARPAEKLLILPVTAAAGVARDHEIKAWDKREVLSTGARFGTCIRRNACATSIAFPSEA